jgi:hypothetical protein
MYYQDYDDYMKKVLGYQTNPMENLTYQPTYQAAVDPYNNPNVQSMAEERTEMYPDIYKIVYPMVCKVCDENAGMPVTDEAVEEMTNTVYSNVEADVDVNIEANVKKEVNNRNGDVKNPNAKEPERETRQRRPGNRLLRDLIRILILRELFDRRPPRPPFPGPRPPRPPFPGPRPYRSFDYGGLYY